MSLIILLLKMFKNSHKDYGKFSWYVDLILSTQSVAIAELLEVV